EDAPPATFPEYAFIGRSNVGKSSLINMLVNQRKLAHTSNTPGKTQLLNFFIVNNAWYLVDLPGYGYAKRSKKIRDSWDAMISRYLLTRKNLLNTFVLVDSRLKPQTLDKVIMANMAENQLPFTIVFTKSDKLKPGELKRNLSFYEQELKSDWEKLPPVIVTSSVDHRGRDEILELISKSNALFQR
ncbi:MAG: ribosome biogenesis GTP-binding protein YihA/YsxC, partial [Bacteroidota bacterium]